MRKIIVGIASLTMLFVPYKMAFGYGHANRYGGGYTSHSGNTTTRTNAYGGSATHTAGQGTSATNAYGGSASHAEGSGTTTATNAYGGSATHYQGEGTVGTTSSGQTVYASDHYAYGAPTAYGYHPPTTVAVYGSSCYNCNSGWGTAGAVVAGAVVGATVATAVVASNNAAAANVAAANANAAAANAYAAANVNYAVGQMTAVLPAGCVTPQVNGQAYYLCGDTWFLAAYGANE